MTGSDSEGGGGVSQADFASFRQDTANEMAQFQAVLQKSMDDFVDATRRPVSGEGTSGAGGLGPQSGGSAAGGPLPSQGSTGATLPGQPIVGGPGGAGALGQPVGSLGSFFAGVPPPTFGAAGYPVAGTMDAYAGRPGPPYPGQAGGLGAGPGQAGGLGVGPGGGYGYGGGLGGASSPSDLLGPAGGIAAGPGGGVGYRGTLAGAGATGAPIGQPSGLAVGNTGGVGYGNAWGGAGAVGASYGQMGTFTLGSGAGLGHGGALGGAGAIGAPYGHAGGHAVGPGMGFGLNGARGGAGAIGGPSMAFGQAARDGLGAPGVGRASLGDGGACDPSTTLGKQINKIVTARAVASWGNPSTRLWQVICGGRPASMQRTAVQGYVGDAVDISARVHTMLESLDAIDFLVFVPRGGAGVDLPLAQHLCILGHAIVTVASRGLPQDAADLHVARARVEALRVAFESGAKMLNDHVMEHYAIANTRGNRTRLAELIKKDLVKFTLDLRVVSDVCGHDWAYPPPVSAFPAIPGPYWPRLKAYINSGGLINADVLQPAAAGPAPAKAGVAAGECRQWGKTGTCRFARCVFTHVGPARAAGNGTKRKGENGGGSADGGAAASGAAAADAPAKKAKGKGKTGAAGSGGGGGSSGGGGSGSGGGGSGSGGSGSGGGGGSGASGGGPPTHSATAKADE